MNGTPFTTKDIVETRKRILGGKLEEKDFQKFSPSKDLPDWVFNSLIEDNIPVGDVEKAAKIHPAKLQEWVGEASNSDAQMKRTLVSLLLTAYHLLREVFPTPADSNEWIYSDNALLGGLKPAEVLQVGRADVIENLLLKKLCDIRHPLAPPL